MNYYERQKLAKDRLIELGKQIWSLLTEYEREYYYQFGPLSFIEHIANVVGYDIDYDNVTVIDYIYNKITD